MKRIEGDIKEIQQRIAARIGVKESDLGTAQAHLWDLNADKSRVEHENPLQVARCTKILTSGQKYIIAIKQFAKFVVGLKNDLSPLDIEEGMRVGYRSLIALLPL